MNKGNQNQEGNSDDEENINPDDFIPSREAGTANDIMSERMFNKTLLSRLNALFGTESGHLNPRDFTVLWGEINRLKKENPQFIPKSSSTIGTERNLEPYTICCLTAKDHGVQDPAHAQTTCRLNFIKDAFAADENLSFTDFDRILRVFDWLSITPRPNNLKEAWDNHPEDLQLVIELCVKGNEKILDAAFPDNVSTSTRVFLHYLIILASRMRNKDPSIGRTIAYYMLRRECLAMYLELYPGILPENIIIDKELWSKIFKVVKEKLLHYLPKGDTYLREVAPLDILNESIEGVKIVERNKVIIEREKVSAYVADLRVEVRNQIKEFARAQQTTRTQARSRAK